MTRIRAESIQDPQKIPCRSEPARDISVSATHKSTDSPLSRAGSLLQEIFIVSIIIGINWLHS
ncbi:hypothetical protein EMIT0P265_20415 [Pseudomonas zeae]